MPGQEIARITDTTHGVCTAHHPPITVDGTITTGSPRSVAGHEGIARVGDTVTSSCGHTGTIVSGSSRSSCQGKAIARLGDPFSGTYTGVITSGYGRGTVI
jgi:uncharacterized Zn-binding protein involved in type VI secretion